MPGTTPAASQLDWLISSTTTMVLFCSKAIRERLRSSTWVMGAPPSVFRTTTTVPDLCRRPHSFWTHSGQTKSALKHWFRETGNKTHGFLDNGRGWIGDRLSFRFYAHGLSGGKTPQGH